MNSSTWEQERRAFQKRMRNLPTGNSDIPFLGYKKCFLDIENEKPFASLNSMSGFHSNYGYMDESVCCPWRSKAYGSYYKPEHSGMDIACSEKCGFYAFNDPQDVRFRDFSLFHVHSREKLPMAALLVELYGTVIVHSLGYRASKQRVLKVYLDLEDELTQKMLASYSIDQIQERLQVPVGYMDIDFK